MKPLNILIRTITEKKWAENENGIDGRRGIFEVVNGNGMTIKKTI